VADQERRQEERAKGDENLSEDREELAKLTFDLCKHLTTLSTAGILIVLAVYRELTFEDWLLSLTLVLFGLTVVVSVAIMLSVMTFFTAQGRVHEARYEPLLMRSARISSYLFTAAVWTFMLFLLHYPYLELLTIAVGVVGILLVRSLFRQQNG